MDPNANMREQLEIAGGIVKHGLDDSDTAHGERLAELVIALDEWRSKGAFTPDEPEWLLKIHQMLYPERYPREVQPDHVYWQGQGEDANPLALDCFQWSSDTIEWVATMLEGALASDPRARLKP